MAHGLGDGKPLAVATPEPDPPAAPLPLPRIVTLPLPELLPETRALREGNAEGDDVTEKDLPLVPVPSAPLLPVALIVPAAVAEAGPAVPLKVKRDEALATAPDPVAPIVPVPLALPPRPAPPLLLPLRDAAAEGLAEGGGRL